jgi:hypothetical protein
MFCRERINAARAWAFSPPAFERSERAGETGGSAVGLWPREANTPNRSDNYPWPYSRKPERSCRLLSGSATGLRRVVTRSCPVAAAMNLTTRAPRFMSALSKQRYPEKLGYFAQESGDGPLGEDPTRLGLGGVGDFHVAPSFSKPKSVYSAKLTDGCIKYCRPTEVGISPRSMRLPRYVRIQE